MTRLAIARMLREHASSKAIQQTFPVRPKTIAAAKRLFNDHLPMEPPRPMRSEPNASARRQSAEWGMKKIFPLPVEILEAPHRGYPRSTGFNEPSERS
jgi:hypothetical protein